MSGGTMAEFVLLKKGSSVHMKEICKMHEKCSPEGNIII